MPGLPDPPLTPIEQRILGSLLEKQRTVPDSYPLSLNGLRTASNQATSRDPVTDYDETSLVDALGGLRDRELVRFVKITGIRVVKYHQRLEEQLGLDAEQAALIAVLLLRGPQSAGELKTRTERLQPFADRAAVETALHAMATADPALVRELPRQAGQHDPRWLHLLGDRADAERAQSAGADTRAGTDTEELLAAGAAARDRSVAAEYDRLAETYADTLYGELDGKPFDRWLLDRVADEAQPREGSADQGQDRGLDQGLDVGCGPGQITARLADRGLAMTGLDLSAAMIAQARERRPDLTFVQGSFTVPPMPRGGDPRAPGWALVTAWYALVHLTGSELATTISALARVVRPGGLLALAVHLGPDGYEVQRPGVVVGAETELAFGLHDADAVIAAAGAAGLIDLEWYRRSPLPDEARTERLYLLGRRSSSA